MVGICGNMSGGKTYFAVECICRWLSERHVVCTNIRLKCQGISSYTGIPCVFWKRLYFYLSENGAGYNGIAIKDYHNYPVGVPRGQPGYQAGLVYIVLDEASSVFDSMTNSKDAEIQSVAVWARHTEKRGQMVFLLMQFSSELHKRLRNHITEYISCVNSSTIKLPLLGCGLPWFLRGMSVRQRFMGDYETRVGDAQWVRIVPAIYTCYDTSQIVVGGDIGRRVDISIDETALIERNAKRGLQWLLLVQVLVALSCLSAMCLF